MEKCFLTGTAVDLAIDLCYFQLYYVNSRISYFDFFVYSFGNIIHFPDPAIAQCFAISHRSRFSSVLNQRSHLSLVHRDRKIRGN